MVLVFAHAQFTVDPGVWKVITINGLTYRIFVPSDYASGSNYYFHVAFWGDGEKTGASLSNQTPGNLFASPHNWNGSVTMNDSSVAKFIVFGIPNYGVQSQVYARAVDSVFKVLGSKVDTTTHNFFSTSGFSGGPGRMWDWLVNGASPYSYLFKNTISQSPTLLGIDVTARSTAGRHWVWYSDSDNNNGTKPMYAVSLYNDIGSMQKILTNQYLDSVCHCGKIWDSCMSIKGTQLPHGGNAQNNRWRWLVNPLDGVTPPTPPPPTFVVGTLRQKTYGGRNYLYYVPDTAQRSTLKYYFIYNTIDSTGKDSAYAVQRGLAKKYKNGWNGRLPLCNGDTAVFTMVTQITDPTSKLAFEGGIQWALDSLPNHVFDTAYARRGRNVLTGIGYGPNTELTYLMNKYVGGQGTAYFRKNFGVFISVDQAYNGYLSTDGWANIETPLKSWWWAGTGGGWPYVSSTSTVGKDSADNRNPGPLTKLTLTSANYAATTWDSAYSTSGSLPTNNVFHWIVDTAQCVVTQPPAPTGPFVVGQLRQFTHASKNFLYYIGDTAQRATLKHFFIYNMTDSTGKDSAYAVQKGLAKKYKNGWNGKQPLCNGDTAVYHMVTQLNNIHLKADMEIGIKWSLDSLPHHIFDTAAAVRHRNIFTGIGRSANSQLTYLMNKFSVNGQGQSVYYKAFGVYVSLDHYDNGHMDSDGWTVVVNPLKTWWWTSHLSGYPYGAYSSRHGRDSAKVRNPGALTKYTEIAASYSPITWDSAYSTLGSTSATNVFIWIADTSYCNGLLRQPTLLVEKAITNEDPYVIGIAPNPAYGTVNIGWTATTSGVTTIQIVDLKGTVLSRKTVGTIKGYNRTTAQVQHLPQGQYIIQVLNGQKIVTKKLLKL